MLELKTRKNLWKLMCINVKKYRTDIGRYQNINVWKNWWWILLFVWMQSTIEMEGFFTLKENVCIT